MTCTNFNTGTAEVGDIKVVGNVTYQYKGNEIWEAITAPLKVSQLTDSEKLRKATTVEEIALGDFKVGDRLEVTDRVNAMFVVVSGGTPDGGAILNAGTGKTAQLQVSANVVYASQFGILFDLTDETDKFELMLDYGVANGFVIDGEGRPIRTTLTKTYSPTGKVTLNNLNIIAGNDYTDQPFITFNADVEYEVNNLTVDGERDIRTAGTENWQVFTTEQGVNSITPISPAILNFGNYGTSKIAISGVIGRNLVADSVLAYFSHGTVNLADLAFKNCGNKTFHGFHGVDGGSQPDTGVTNLDGYSARDCGIMPATFLVDGTLRNRSDNYAPQGSFGCIVSFGNFNHTNVYVKNYGSTGVTPDRCVSANGSNIIILHDDINAFSNNPSGAYWNELCGSCNVSNINISISARDARETAMENSLLQVYVANGGDCTITNAKFETSANANIDKDIRASLQPGSSFKIDGYDLESNASQTALSVLQVSGLSKLVSMGIGRVRGAPINITQSAHTKIDGLDFDETLTIATSLPSPIGMVEFLNSSCSSLAVNGSTGDISIHNSKISGNLGVASSGAGKLSLSNGTVITGLTYIAGVKFAGVGTIETSRRVEFGDIERVKVVGATIKSDAGEPLLWFNPVTAGFMQRATVMSTSLWAKTGTVGAGGITFNANVVASTDIGNEFVTVDWT